MEDYVLLKGKIVDKHYDMDKKAHYHIIAETFGERYDIAVNVGSVRRSWSNEAISNSELLVYHDDSYNRPVLDKIVEKDYGLYLVEQDFALDYVRMDLFDKKKMKLMPTIDDERTYLIEVIENYVSRALDEDVYDLYVYGMLYEDGKGIHDVHMNQGSVARYRHMDRDWSDGGIFLHNKEDKSWTAIFLAFKNQKFQGFEF